MSAGMRTIIYPVTDLAAAKAVYGSLLGVAPCADAAHPSWGFGWGSGSWGWIRTVTVRG